MCRSCTASPAADLACFVAAHAVDLACCIAAFLQASTSHPQLLITWTPLLVPALLPSFAATGRRNGVEYGINRRWRIFL
jgi:hypothetical protein